jgi:hypothetical protein
VNSELQIDDRHFQSMRRWWTGQNREELYRYMRDELSEYTLFLDMVNIAVNHHRFNPEFQAILDNNIAFASSILPGLKLLPHLYPSYEMFNSAIQWAIDRLDAFLQRHSSNAGKCILPSIHETQRI